MKISNTQWAMGQFLIMEQKQKKGNAILVLRWWFLSPFPSLSWLNVTINCVNWAVAMAKLDRNLRRSKHSLLVKSTDTFYGFTKCQSPSCCNCVAEDPASHKTLTAALWNFPVNPWIYNWVKTRPLLIFLYIFAYKFVTSLWKFLLICTMSCFFFFFQAEL